MVPRARAEAGGRRSAVAVGLGLTGLTTVVAVTSRASVHGSGGGIGAGSGGAHAIETALLALGVVAALAVTGAVAAALWPATLRPRRHDPDDLPIFSYRPDMPWWVKVVMVSLPALLFAAVIAAVIVVHPNGGSPPAQRVLPPRAPSAGTGTAPPAAAAPRPASGSSPVLAHALIGAGVVVVAAAAAALVVSRRRRPPPPGEGERAALAEAVEWSLDDLRREPDPRRAVIAAYARMERMLADRGVGRHASEAPLEYLARVLALAQVGAAPIQALTGLFQEARFSPHTIGPRQRDEAVDTLTAIRADLERE